MKRNLFFTIVCGMLMIGFTACGGSTDVKKSKAYMDLKAELDKIKAGDSTEAANIAAYKKLNDDFCAGKREDFLAGVADNYVDHNQDTMLTKKQGKEACAEGFDVVNGSNSEMKVNYVHMYAEGDYVFAHTSMSGKMSGSMGPGIPAMNGNYTEVDFFEVIRYENGKCAERWGLMDGAKMMAQIAASNTTTTEQPK